MVCFEKSFGDEVVDINWSVDNIADTLVIVIAGVAIVVRRTPLVLIAVLADC